ncbi:c-type cytochrome biogenesis protein CcmI [Alteromonas confluentis]|uniref:C-type cytochrome biogenesis protein CcmI n=1 Tax=Alteromonas confluentis TaxID=1656094 RepID=A0A1E7Z677_9ALTE|nr:c-type cytochrome biogenesis protein CcmI [Alteromonas confluentis]OFC69035.1 c-type cytochrome biogenesis protein CcmI [Alteromonas confluentis]
MSWAEFWLIASGLITLVIVLVATPWLRRRQVTQRDVASNISIVKQRLAELDREAREGLISESDKQKASDELKLALVDEAVAEKQGSHRNAAIPLALGAVIAIVVAGVVYSSVNHLQQVEQATTAIESLPELSEKLASGNGQDFTAQDITSLAYAIRQRLRDEPEDATGWMYLGRLWMSVGEDDQAIQAIEKALSIKPEDTTIRITYAQALMVTENAQRLAKAQSVLGVLNNENPDNDNLALMMAVVSARLGDLPNTRLYFAKIENKLPPQNETRIGIAQRIAELEAQLQDVPAPSESAARTGFDIAITVSDEMRSMLPETGYLIVYAQDNLSENRMPAAVVKMPLQNFPVSLSLTTDNAMMPAYTVASLTQAKLIARISSDDDVMPAAGDLQGVLSAPVKPGEVLPIAIQINKELK